MYAIKLASPNMILVEANYLRQNHSTKNYIYLYMNKNVIEISVI